MPTAASRCLAAPLLLSLFLPAAQAAAASSREAAEAVSDIHGRLAAHDCAGAVDALKAGLKKAYPEVALLAGSMYENGLCVRASWANAVTFYTRAHHGGLPEAADRLAAGYADPANGADVAAALWWSQQGRGSRFSGCAVSPEARQDPDRFVAELNTWPQSRVAACNYVVGVMSTLAAEVKYPREAQANAIGGEVTLRFLPGVPRIELKKGDTEVYQLYGLIDGDKMRDREDRAVTGSFEKTMRTVADRALRRYPQPAGIPADTQVTMTYRFSLE